MKAEGTHRPAGPIAPQPRGLRGGLLVSSAAVLWLLGVGAAPAQVPGGVGASAGEKLVPGVFRPLTDDRGATWNLQQNGVIGRAKNGLASGALVLQVNNMQFYNYQPLMTPDGLEFVLDNNQANLGLQVTRRIRLDKRDGGLRYLELLGNPGPAAVTATVELRSNLGGRFAAFHTDRGRQDVSSLEKRETGVLVVPKTAGMRGLIFTMASPKSTLKPVITHQNEYQFNFAYQVTIPAGQTVALLHTVTEVDVPEEFDARTLGRLFRGAALARKLKSLRPEHRPLVANFDSGTGLGRAALMASMTLEGLGIERARSDVLALGDRTRLLGTASCGSLEVETNYGRAAIPFERVAAIVGGNRGRSGTARVFLRDGQVFTGQVRAAGLRFAMPSGASLDLDVDNLDRLVRSEAPGEGRWSEEAAALLETFRGDRIALAAGSVGKLSCVTPWGGLDFAVDELAWLSPPEDEPVGHRIEFRDGSRFFAFLGGGDITAESLLFGPFSIGSLEVRSLVTRAVMAESGGQGASDAGEAVEPSWPEGGSAVAMPEHPFLVLSGGQRLLARVDAPALTAVTNAEAIELPPETIRRLRNLREEVLLEEDEPSRFEIELWGGGVIVGQLRDAVVPVRFRSELWQIPVEDLSELVTPLPQVSDASRQRIAALIRDLGSDEWRSRESATEELAEFGYLARPFLEEALRVNPDPEVRRRLEKLLGDLAP